MPTLRRSSRGKKRYTEPEDESYTPGHINKEDLTVRPVGYGLRQRIKETEVELLMECEEEALLPAQIEAFKRDMEEFEAAKRKVKAAKEEQMRLQQQQQQQQQQQVLRQQQAVSAAQKKVVAPTSAPQPDVIIVGESPPKQTVNSQPAQPTVTSGARLINPVPQQVYKFVNLPGQTVSNNNQWVVRPLMQVMPQQTQPRVQNQANIQKSPYAPRQISPQFPSAQGTNYGARRPVPYNTEQQQQYVSPPRKKVRRPEDDFGALVPLDEYYYGKKEGDPTYLEEKGEHRFKCWYCSKMLYNNVKTMMHMQGHIDSEKQQNLDLSDLTQCKHCYKQFDTPFEMQTHIEKVHMNNANVLLCRICEKDHESRQSLTNHMRQNHNACEMPYICQLCHFRSSMYSDVVDHFKKKHEHSDCVLCLYCLKVFHIKFVSQGWGQTQNYYHHLLRHQSKTNAKKCQLCKLTFFNGQDVKAHRKKDHMPNQKGVIGMNAKYTTPDQVMIRVPESGLQPKQQGVKSLNAPAVSKVSEHRGLRFPRAVMELYCFECKMVMATNDHYKKYIQCSMCRFATSCSFAYANHMMGFHSGQMTSLSLNIPWDRPLPHLMYCLCGFGSKYGNKIANHLVFCTKRSCYKDKPAPQPKEDKGDEEQDPRRKPGASILDVLGLVKKPNIVSTDMLGDESGDRRFESPEREQTPSPEPIPSDVPEELTGAQMWLTVKLKDDKTPTKSAVFGADEESRPFTPDPEDRSRDGEDINALVQSALEAEEEDSGGQTGDKSSGEAETEGDCEGKTRSEESKGGTDARKSMAKTDTQASESKAETDTQGSEFKADTNTRSSESKGETHTHSSDSKGETSGETRPEKPAGEGETVGQAEERTEDSSLETESKEDTESDVFRGDTETSGEMAEYRKIESKEVTETREAESKGGTEKCPEDGQTRQDLVDQEEESPSIGESEKNVVDVVKDDGKKSAKDDAECDNAEASKENVQEDAEEDNHERAEDTTEMDVSQSSECDRDKDGDEKVADSEVNRDLKEESVERHAGEETEMESSGQTKMDSQSEETEETQEDSSQKRPASPVNRQDSPGERQDDSQQKEELSRDVITAGDEDISKPETCSRLEGETLPDTQSKTIGEERSEENTRPEDSEGAKEEVDEEKQCTDIERSRSLVSESYDESGELGETEGKVEALEKDSITSTSSSLVTQEPQVSEKQSSNPQTLDKYGREQSGRPREADRERSRDHYRDRSDERDRSHDRGRWDRSRDSERSGDRSREHDRAYDRDRDRRDHHRSDRDRHSYGGGYRDRYDDRRHQNDNRNYNRYQGGHQRDYHGGYHGSQSHYQGSGYRDNYGNQRDRHGQGNRGHGNREHGNRDYRGRGQGYHNKY